MLSKLEGFEQKLESVSMFEKKELIRMVVEKIVVDRETDQIQCYLRALPAIQEIEEFKKENSWVDTVAPMRTLSTQYRRRKKKPVLAI